MKAKTFPVWMSDRTLAQLLALRDGINPRFVMSVEFEPYRTALLNVKEPKRKGKK